MGGTQQWPSCTGPGRSSRDSDSRIGVCWTGADLLVCTACRWCTCIAMHKSYYALDAKCSFREACDLGGFGWQGWLSRHSTGSKLRKGWFWRCSYDQLWILCSFNRTAAEETGTRGVLDVTKICFGCRLVGLQTGDRMESLARAW
jgi:hypothetical protein